MRVLSKLKKPKATRILGGALGLLLVLSLVLMPTVPALAVPQMPHQFYGTVTIGEDLAPEGTIVSAQIGEVEYLSTTVDAEGRYGYHPDYGGTGIFKVPADDPSTPEKEGGVAGETVDLYVSYILAGQYEFEIWGITGLNLTVAAVAPEVDTSNPTQNSIDLIWTTPEAGTRAYSYFDIRYSEDTITSDNWGKATRVVGEPVPAAGASQGMRVKGLGSSTKYYFAMKLVDEEGFVGLLSNIASDTTWAAAPSDEISPAQITELVASPGSPATTRVILVWKAPGDDGDIGTATSYEIRRSTSATITEANWSSATIIYNNIVPQAAGGLESFVARLTPNRTYYFAIQAKDEVGNASLTSNSPSRPTAANLPTITGISPTIGDNSQARTLTIDGTNFVDGGTNVVRFGSGKNTFDLTNVTCGISTQLTAKVPKGAPTGTYKVRVINGNGTSELSSVTYEVTEALKPLPLVTNLIPQMAASNTPVRGVKIFGKNLTGATEVSFGDTKATSFTVVSSGTKITVDVPGLSAGEYDVKVTTPAGTNEISGVKFVVSYPVAITEDMTEDTTTYEVVDLDTNVIPVQLTLTTDTSETATQATDADVEIGVVIPPQTRATDSEGNDYTGNIHPPRVVKPDESELTYLADNAVVIEMGNPEKTIHFDKAFVATIIITADTEPVIWYYNKDTGAYELAGMTGTKDGVDYVRGGTKLGQENSTYTMGLLLDHMSAYVAGVKPNITSAPATVTAGSAFTITGTNFHPAAQVYFGGTAGTIVSCSTTQIVARFSTVGSYTLTVKNPDELFDTTSITLTTPPLSPSVTTGDATSVNTTSATLNGSLNSLGTASSVAVSFEWGQTSGAYDNETTPKAMTATDAFSADLSNLSANTTYYFRAKAMGDGISYGDESSFTTVTITFIITATAEEGGTISPSGEVVVNYGESETFTITPDTGYEIADVLVDGESIGVEASYLFENVTADHTIHATFALETFTITATAGDNGSISPSGDVVANYGADQAFTITPDTGYEIADVLVDGASVSVVMDEAGVGNYTFENVVTDHSISANFTEIPVAYYTLTVTCDPTEGGSVSLDPEQPAGGYAADTSVELTATPEEDYDFANWSGDLTGSTNPDTITMDSDKEVIANFAEIVAPAVTTDSATGIGTTTTTLNGTLTNLGSASSVEVSFEWGETTSYGNETATQTMTSTDSFSVALSGLSPNTSYHFRAVAVGDGTGYGVDRTFTTRARPAGGGGIGPRRVPAGTTDVRGEISWEGVFEEPVTAFSDDELCTLTIPEGTVGLTEELEPLDEITMVIMDEPPPPPEDAHVVGLAYDFGPDGATFDPPITLTFSYDPADIPEGKDVLVVAYYDEVAGAWVYLEGVVDPVTKTITVKISHFTCFAIIARAPPPPAPAAFSVTNLSVKPLEVEPKEVVTISLSVANTGGTEGSYTVVLKINGVKEVEKSVTVAARSRKMVAFSITKEEAGSYSVVVDGLSASFTVVAPPVEEEEEVAPPEEEEEVVPEVKPPFPWPLVGGIIGGVVVVVGLIIFFLIRRREVRAWLRRYRTNG